MFRAIAITAAVLLLSNTLAFPDIGPKPTTSGSTPVAIGKDMKGIEVEMAEEKVDLLLSRVDETSYRLEVRAEFCMKNHGETATFETGFPIGNFGTMKEFSVVIDGKAVDHKVARRGANKRREFWFVWQAAYPGSKASRHVVEYAIAVTRHSVSPAYAGYVLHTGGPWKGPIGKATITLRCGEGISFEEFIRFQPHDGGTRKANRVVWSFENLEPTKANDITFYWHDRKLEDDIARARREAETLWSARSSVASLLSCRPGLDLRDRMTPEEFAEYIEAVATIVEGIEEKGDRIVLPRTDAKGDRSYVGSPDNILNRIVMATEIAKEYPESDRAKELLRVFVDICEKFLAGRLYAGDVQLELPWRGKLDTEKERARRDESVRARRAVIETRIERARKVLTTE